MLLLFLFEGPGVGHSEKTRVWCVIENFHGQKMQFILTQF